MCLVLGWALCRPRRAPGGRQPTPIYRRGPELETGVLSEHSGWNGSSRGRLAAVADLYPGRDVQSGFLTSPGLVWHEGSSGVKEHKQRPNPCMPQSRFHCAAVPLPLRPGRTWGQAGYSAPVGFHCPLYQQAAASARCALSCNASHVKTDLHRQAL